MKNIKFYLISFIVTLGSIFGSLTGYHITNNHKNISYINDDVVTGSVIGETESVTISGYDGSTMVDGSLFVERDVIDSDDFNPYEDYSSDELYLQSNSMFGSDYAVDYILMHIESSHYVDDSIIKNLEFEKENGQITYNSIKDQDEVFPNVKRIAYVLPYETFNSIFPWRLPAYTYEGFLKAAQKFPRYCGEKSLANPYTMSKTIEEVCSMELAMTFAHFRHETGGLQYIEESFQPKFVPGATDSYRRTCGATTARGRAYPCAEYVPGKGYPNYHWRGSKQLSYNYNYGPYSRVKYGIEDTRILNEPWLIGNIDNDETTQMDETTLFESAIYFGMVPRGAKPSMHWIASGIWTPTNNELGHGHKYGFHATTNVINGGVECGAANAGKAEPFNRSLAFIDISKVLGVWVGYGDQLINPAGEDCRGYQPYGSLTTNLAKGYGYIQNWAGDIVLASYENQGPFTMYFPGDYHRAVKSAENDGLMGQDIVGWEEGKDVTYTKDGDLYRDAMIFEGFLTIEAIS